MASNTSTTEVAVTFIRNGEKLLLVYNEKWGAYTFPMTKRHTSESASDQSLTSEEEDWRDAAARPVVECLGRPSQPRQILDDFVPEQHMSRRQGTAKFYKYMVFEVEFRDDDRIAAARPTLWLTPEEITSGTYRPISPTAIALANYDTILKALGLQP